MQVAGASPGVGVKAYLRLARIQTAGVTATVPVYGAVAAALSLGRDVEAALQPVGILAPLLVIGALAHLFGFVHNEIADLSVDAKAATRRRKPLPAAEVSVRRAWGLASFGLAGGLAVALGLALVTSPLVFVLAVLSAGLAFAYNVRGKAFAGGDLLLAASIAAFVLLGAAAVGGQAALLGSAVLGVALLAGLVLFFNNAFEGGFKDHESDEMGGKRTLVLALRARGARYDSPDGMVVMVSLGFHALLLAIALVVMFFPLASRNPPADVARAAAAVVLVAAMARFFVRGVAVSDRKQMLTFFGIHEALAVLLLIDLLLPGLGWALGMGLFLAPLLVFAMANRALYGTMAAPDV
jgi:4-hydroxybenzoate polyprenyltransferase